MMKLDDLACQYGLKLNCSTGTIFIEVPTSTGVYWSRIWKNEYGRTVIASDMNGEMIEESLDNGIMLDVGAYAGRYTVPMSLKAHKVYAFEADPSSADILRNTVRRLKHVEVLNFAVWNQSGIELPMFRKARTIENTLNVSRANDAEGNTGQIKVKTLRLDDYCKNMKGITGIKIDVEGAEEYVIEGALETLKRERALVALETHTNVNVDKVYRMLLSCGYEMYSCAGKVDHLVEEAQYIGRKK